MTRRSELVLLALIIALSAVAARRWLSVTAESATAASVIPPAPPLPQSPRPDSLDALLIVATETNVFRLSHLPAQVAFSRVVTAAPSVAPAAPRPALVLKGIVGGPPWQALIDGLPGQPPGTLVKAGSAFEKITIRAVSKDTVVVQGADTTWRLTMRRTP